MGRGVGVLALVVFAVFSSLTCAEIAPPATPEEIAGDVAASKHLMEQAAPEGFLSVFGGARVVTESPHYEEVRRFARLWTKEMGRVPIAT